MVRTRRRAPRGQRAIRQPWHRQPGADAQAGRGAAPHPDLGDSVSRADLTDLNHEIGVDPSTFQPVNIDRARIRGVEVQADWHNRDWRIGGQLTAMEPLNLSPGPDYRNVLNRRARQSASLSLRRFLRAPVLEGTSGSIGVVGRWEGRRYDDLANTLPMGGYLSVDLLTQWALGNGWSLEARAANLFDRNYQTAAYFAQDGRHYGLTARYQTRGK
ncbi:MAG: TonB-dependent receptor [Gammaproteobacteria bacterium]|nr:MAG: TonB-dependent receptor [Gammaproteobacteria bacterium]